jgi:hypothetical protein
LSGPATGEGEEAFDQHLLLAVTLHRVSRLHKFKGESDTKGWIRYMTDLFPGGRNDPGDAYLLSGPNGGAPW